MWKSKVLGKQMLFSVVRAGSVCGVGWQEARGQSGDLGTRERGWVKPGWQGRLLWCRLSSRRRQWHPTPVLLPGKSHGRRSLVGYSPWGH